MNVTKSIHGPSVDHPWIDGFFCLYLQSDDPRKLNVLASLICCSIDNVFFSEDFIWGGGVLPKGPEKNTVYQYFQPVHAVPFPKGPLLTAVSPTAIKATNTELSKLIISLHTCIVKMNIYQGLRHRHKSTSMFMAMHKPSINSLGAGDCCQGKQCFHV